MRKNKWVLGSCFFIKLAAAAGLTFLLLSCGGSSAAERPNILFIIVDDLRPELGCYGNAEIKTPHIDRFAQEAFVFTRAYCQAAACAPSRASVMLGMRPDTTRVWSLGEKFREINPAAVTLPQHSLPPLPALFLSSARSSSKAPGILVT